jgi:hypothetical protein
MAAARLSHSGLGSAVRRASPPAYCAAARSICLPCVLEVLLELRPFPRRLGWRPARGRGVGLRDGGRCSDGAHFLVEALDLRLLLALALLILLTPMSSCFAQASSAGS